MCSTALIFFFNYSGWAVANKICFRLSICCSSSFAFTECIFAVELYPLCWSRVARRSSNALRSSIILKAVQNVFSITSEIRFKVRERPLFHVVLDAPDVAAEVADAGNLPGWIDAVKEAPLLTATNTSAEVPRVQVATSSRPSPLKSPTTGTSSPTQK